MFLIGFLGMSFWVLIKLNYRLNEASLLYYENKDTTTINSVAQNIMDEPTDKKSICSVFIKKTKEGYYTYIVK